MTDLMQLLWQSLGAASAPDDDGADDGADDDVAKRLRVTGPELVLPSVYDVTGLATAAVAAAALAMAEVWTARGHGSDSVVEVDRRQACAAFRSEALLAPSGWTLPPIWDPIAGDYRAEDGWIRLHTNYAHHRDAALRALGLAPDPTPTRDLVADAVRRWKRADVEAAVVAAGGAAAAMYAIHEWAEHPHGRVAVREPVVRVERGNSPVRPPPMADGGLPLSGIRVLDLTRVIAGPVCTRTLAAWGADVLRIDPPSFPDVPAALPDTTVGKRCAVLDLGSADGKRLFADLVRKAHVVVHGLRPGALAALGLGDGDLRALNPALIITSVDAYGWLGPWAGRRGFDSLVQMSCGIAAAGGDESGSDRPVPLPAQALDHSAGYLMAAAVGRGLARLLRDGAPSTVRTSLVGVANVLMGLPTPGGLEHAPPLWGDADLVPRDTDWGPARGVPCPGLIRVGDRTVRPGWTRPAGPLGRHPAQW